MLKDLHKDYAASKQLREKLEELGAKLQEQSESLILPGSKSGRTTFHDSANKLTEPVTATPVSPAPVKRSNIELIREVIASSNFEWTTIGRIMNKTGLSHDDILREVRSAPDIEIGHGRQTGDYLFKFNKLWFKPFLSDPEWRRDPTAKAREEAHKAVDELAEKRRNDDD